VLGVELANGGQGLVVGGGVHAGVMMPERVVRDAYSHGCHVVLPRRPPVDQGAAAAERFPPAAPVPRRDATIAIWLLRQSEPGD
jgi:hypothetical protein